MRQLSIVLPNFNSVKHLSRVMDAFLAQDYPLKRLLVVDGKSTDGSHKVIARYADKHPEIFWIREQDRGISNAINIALDYVNENDIWGYLGSDDLLLHGILSKVASMFDLEQTTSAVYFDSYSLHSKESTVLLRRCPQTAFSSAALIKYGTIVGLQNIYIDARLVKKLRFNERIKYAMDYELYLRLVMEGNIMFFYRPEPSSINIQDGNISQVFSKKATEEALMIAFQLTGPSVMLIKRFVRYCLSNAFRHLVKWLAFTNNK